MTERPLLPAASRTDVVTAQIEAFHKSTVDEVRAALSAGEFKVLPWATCIALALLHLTADGTVC